MKYWINNIIIRWINSKYINNQSVIISSLRIYLIILTLVGLGMTSSI